jgi:hypothetical protein
LLSFGIDLPVAMSHISVCHCVVCCDSLAYNQAQDSACTE